MNTRRQAAVCLAVFLTAAGASARAQSASPLVFDADGRPSAQVRVNDAGDFLFAVDTAAQRTGVGAPVIDALALEPDPVQRAQLHGVAGSVNVPMYQLASIEVGARRVEESYAVSLTGGHDQGGHAHEGILGQDVFVDQRLEMDFTDMELRLAPSHDAPAQSRLEADLMYGGFALVDIEVGGVPTVALVDTGAALSFGNEALLAALARPGERIQVRDEIRGTSQDVIAVKSGLTRPVEIGSTTLESLPLEFIGSGAFDTFRIDDRPAMVLGMDILGRLPGIALDYEDRAFEVLAP